MFKWITSICVVLSLMTNSAYGMTVKATGYFPDGYKSKAQRIMEGGKYDRWGIPLRTLQDYQLGSYVSVATDPHFIKSGTYFTLKEIPNILFYACDVGDAIKGRHIDICVKTEAHTYELPRKVTIDRKERVHGKLNTTMRRWFEGSRYNRIKETVVAAYILYIQELQRRDQFETGLSEQSMVRFDKVPSNTPVVYASVGLGQERRAGFYHK